MTENDFESVMITEVRSIDSGYRAAVVPGTVASTARGLQLVRSAKFMRLARVDLPEVTLDFVASFRGWSVWAGAFDAPADRSFLVVGAAIVSPKGRLLSRTTLRRIDVEAGDTADLTSAEAEFEALGQLGINKPALCSSDPAQQLEGWRDVWRTFFQRYDTATRAVAELLMDRVDGDGWLSDVEDYVEGERYRWAEGQEP